jgi:hypothetical protein
MALLQALLAWLLHSLGRVVNSAVSWATLLLFGKVPDNRQTVLSVICLSSVLWLLAVVGFLFPRFGAFLFLLAPPQSVIGTHWISYSMLALAVLIPCVNGILSLWLDNRDNHNWKDKWIPAALSGWKLTLALSVTVWLMLIIAPINRLNDLFRKWRSEYIAVVIEPRDYVDVTNDLRAILESAGIKCTEQKPSLVMQAPVWLLVALAGGMLKQLVAEKLTKLVYEDGELEIRPSDLIVRGTRQRTNDVMALIIAEFGFGKAYLSWTKEANRLEDELRNTWLSVHDNKVPISRALKMADASYEKLQKLHLRKEEWEILYRLWLKLKLDIWESSTQFDRKVG